MSGIRVFPGTDKFKVQIYYDGTTHALGTVHSLREAVRVFNKEAAKRGKPLNVLRRQDKETRAAVIAGTTAPATSPPARTPNLPAPFTKKAKITQKKGAQATARGGGGGVGGGGGRGGSGGGSSRAVEDAQARALREGAKPGDRHAGARARGHRAASVPRGAGRVGDDSVALPRLASSSTAGW